MSIYAEKVGLGGLGSVGFHGSLTYAGACSLEPTHGIWSTLMVEEFRKRSFSSLTCKLELAHWAYSRQLGLAGGGGHVRALRVTLDVKGTLR